MTPNRPPLRAVVRRKELGHSYIVQMGDGSVFRACGPMRYLETLECGHQVTRSGRCRRRFCEDCGLRKPNPQETSPPLSPTSPEGGYARPRDTREG